jgi:hypothetical protein
MNTQISRLNRNEKPNGSAVTDGPEVPRQRSIMKSFSTITLASLVAVVIAAPAAAASKIEVSVSSPNPTLGTPVTYQVSGEAEVGETYQVNILDGPSSQECFNQIKRVQGPSSVEVLRPVQVGRQHESSIESFSQSAMVPIEDYSALGTYTVCAMVRLGVLNTGSFAESATSFTVVAAPAPEPKSEPTSEITSPAPAPTPAATPVTPRVTPVAKPVSKLAKALTLCKKLKKHSKRVACEKRAKRRYKK